jgi:DNA damage-inducible protein 1
MSITINCPTCTFRNDIHDTKQHNCCICFNLLPKINSNQLLNIREADEKHNIIMKNYLKAIEIIPEFYTKSPSIFIKGSINGNMIKFLIDTGAEISVMSKNTAIACGLSKYIDESYCGKLIGTGETKIMGKVHYTEIVFDWGVLPCGFTICNTENITSIIGIDMLNSHGTIIDFKNKTLNIGKHIIKWCK